LPTQPRPASVRESQSNYNNRYRPPPSPLTPHSYMSENPRHFRNDIGQTKRLESHRGLTFLTNPTIPLDATAHLGLPPMIPLIISPSLYCSYLDIWLLMPPVIDADTGGFKVGRRSRRSSGGGSRVESKIWIAPVSRAPPFSRALHHKFHHEKKKRKKG
jgi:hypothetical protein